MQKSIVISPIKKARPTNTYSAILSDRMSKMKIGNFFEISGLSSKTDVRNMRAAVSYVSKKEKVKVTTSLIENVLKVERVKSPVKTKETSTVK